MTTMSIEAFGVLYDIGKDIVGVFAWKEETKLVDMQWVEKSGFDKYAAEKGYTLRWTNPDKVESRKLEGYDVMFEVNSDEHVRYKLMLEGGQVLMGKR